MVLDACPLADTQPGVVALVDAGVGPPMCASVTFYAATGENYFVVVGGGHHTVSPGEDPEVCCAVCGAAWPAKGKRASLGNTVRAARDV